MTDAPRPPRRVLMIVNPRARNGSAPLDRAVGRFEAAGVRVRVETSASPGEVGADIMRLAPQADAVVVCGGDGSINAAAPGVMQSGLPMGVIPMGTANDFARTLNLPPDPADAAGVVIAGRTRPIDVGLVNGAPFFNVASVGLSVDLADELNASGLKKRWGRLSYAIAAIRVALRARPFSAWITAGGETVMVKTYQVAVGNGRHYGGGVIVAEDAAIDDGRLDLYSLEFDTVWRMATMVRAFRAGMHGAFETVRTRSHTEFHLRTRKPRPVNADGEIAAWTPATFTLRRGAARVFIP
jgi:YegS/Rv2252/BmrU family lipid kinase